MKSELKEFDDLLVLGELKKEVKIGKHTFVLRTLKFSEFSEISSLSPQNLQDQIKVLVESIETIDGKIVDKELKLELLKNMQVIIINKLMNAYIELMDEQTKLVEDVKKNS